MKYSEAIMWIKNLDYPATYENENEKAIAIGTILKMETINSVKKDDLRNCVEWLWNMCFEWEQPDKSR